MFELNVIANNGYINFHHLLLSVLIPRVGPFSLAFNWPGLTVCVCSWNLQLARLNYV